MSKRRPKTIKLSEAMEQTGLSADELLSRLRPARHSNGAIYLRRAEVESLLPPRERKLDTAYLCSGDRWRALTVVD